MERYADEVRELRSALDEAKLGHILSDLELAAVIFDCAQRFGESCSRNQMLECAKSRAFEVAEELSAGETPEAR